MHYTPGLGVDQVGNFPEKLDRSMVGKLFSATCYVYDQECSDSDSCVFAVTHGCEINCLL